jgi:hypothetical protein
MKRSEQATVDGEVLAVDTSLAGSERKAIAAAA